MSLMSLLLPRQQIEEAFVLPFEDSISVLPHLRFEQLIFHPSRPPRPGDSDAFETDWVTFRCDVRTIFLSVLTPLLSLYPSS